MSAPRWSFIGPLIGLMLIVGAGLFLATTSSSPPDQSSPSTKAAAPPPPGGPSQVSDAKRAPAPARPRPVRASKSAEAPESAAPKSGGAPASPRAPKSGRLLESAGQPGGAPPGGGASLGGQSPGARLKSYEELWTDPHASELRAAELQLLAEFERLPPPELVALLRHGLSTRSANLVLITLENAMQGARREEYDDALAEAIKAASEQPDLREVLSGIRKRFSS